MNPVLQEAAHHAEYGWIAGVITAVFLGCFLFWTWWAFAPRNRSRFEEAARMPLTNGDEQE